MSENSEKLLIQFPFVQGYLYKWLAYFNHHFNQSRTQKHSAVKSYLLACFCFRETLKVPVSVRMRPVVRQKLYQEFLFRLPLILFFCIGNLKAPWSKSVPHSPKPDSFCTTASCHFKSRSSSSHN